MELREFILLFWNQRRIILGIVASSIICGWLVYDFQSPSVVADLTLNIGRNGTQQTNDYRYDGFYRLQADERFADTVVQWLKAPRIVEDIVAEADARPMEALPWSFGPVIRAERLSSQVIRVSFRAQTGQEATRLANGVLQVVNRETNQLNGTKTDESWFVVRGADPVVTDGRFGFWRVLLLASAFGLFVSFWAVLFRYYWKRA